MHCSRVDAFRHRAGPIIADHAGVSHVYRFINANGPDRGQNAWARHEGHPPKDCARY